MNPTNSAKSASCCEYQQEIIWNFGLNMRGLSVPLLSRLRIQRSLHGVEPAIDGGTILRLLKALAQFFDALADAGKACRRGSSSTVAGRRMLRSSDRAVDARPRRAQDRRPESWPGPLRRVGPAIGLQPGFPLHCRNNGTARASHPTSQDRAFLLSTFISLPCRGRGGIHTFPHCFSEPRSGPHLLSRQPRSP